MDFFEKLLYNIIKENIVRGIVMKVMVTGHRPQRLKGQEKEISLWLTDMIKKLNADICISGMAQGVDQIFAIQAIEENRLLFCYFPYPRHNYHPQEEYIMEHAAQIKFICSVYSQDCYKIRDYAMVDDCDIVLAVWDGIPHGGTYETIKYAKEQGKPIYYYPWS